MHQQALVKDDTAGMFYSDGSLSMFVGVLRDNKQTFIIHVKALKGYCCNCGQYGHNWKVVQEEMTHESSQERLWRLLPIMQQIGHFFAKSTIIYSNIGSKY